jgi:plastocyanin
MFLAALGLTALPGAREGEPTRTHTVVIEAMKFTPAELRIRPGERVVFQNKDLLPHTATAKEPKAFDSGLIKAGGSWTLQLGSGTQAIRYMCLYHPTMEGRIIVARP